MMEQMISFVRSNVDYLLYEINEITHDVIVTISPFFNEGRLFLSSCIDRSSYETLFYNLRSNANQIYYQLIVVPRNNNFYIPVILNSLQQLRKSVHTWNRSHILAGSVGILVGSYCTILVKNHVLPQMRYLTLMKAVVAKNERGPQGICYIEEAAVPVIVNSSDILVHVRAASIDTIDLEVASERGRVLRELFQNKSLRRKDSFPVVLGRDCSGIVVDTGCNITRFEVGDEVWLSVPYWITGTLAEFVSVRECYVAHKPERLDHLDAASLPYSGCIALDCVKRRAGIVDARSGKGKKVLVHCGDTATGCIIIQLCSLYNVNITTSCVSQAANKMIDAGAHKIIFLDQVSPDLPSFKRFDIIFNTIGASANQFCSNLVLDSGVIIDASSEYYAPVGNFSYFHSSVYLCWSKILRFFGYRAWVDVPINSSLLDELSNLVNEGKLYPVTDCVLSVKYCERAFWFLHKAKTVGKPVLFFSSPEENGF